MIDFISWRNEWLTVIDAVNDQHQDIARDINKIAESYLDTSDVVTDKVKMDRLQQHMDHLSRITRRHFKYEERLMAEVGYREREEHTKEHQIMLAELGHYTKRISDGRDQVNLNVLMAIKSWFIDHLLQSDREFTDFAASKTRSPCLFTSRLSHF